jgi:hypothetical protein
VIDLARIGALAVEVMLPLSRRRAGLPLVRSSVTAPTTSLMVITGVALLPAMVTVTA